MLYGSVNSCFPAMLAGMHASNNVFYVSVCLDAVTVRATVLRKCSNTSSTAQGGGGSFKDRKL